MLKKVYLYIYLYIFITWQSSPQPDTISLKSFDFFFLFGKGRRGEAIPLKDKMCNFLFKAVNMNVFTALSTTLLHRQIIIAIHFLHLHLQYYTEYSQWLVTISVSYKPNCCSSSFLVHCSPLGGLSFPTKTYDKTFSFSFRSTSIIVLHQISQQGAMGTALFAKLFFASVYPVPSVG